MTNGMLCDSLAKTVNSFESCEVVFVTWNGKELIHALPTMLHWILSS